MKSTKKRYKLKKEVKEMIKKGLVCLFVLSLLLLINSTLKTIVNNNRIATQKAQTEVNNYKQCIYNQHKQKGYIIRSECSNNWAILDKKANIQYKQIKKDIYLISINNIEV